MLGYSFSVSAGSRHSATGLFRGGRWITDQYLARSFSVRPVINVNRQALVPHTAADMYELVADVDAYPEFLPWCGSASVEVLSAREVEASIEIVRGRIHKTFTTRNSMRRYEAIQMRLVRGPFRELEGQWQFEALGSLGCKVSLEMHFEFSNALTKILIGAAFSEIANSLVDAFCRRATSVYAEP